MLAGRYPSDEFAELRPRAGRGTGSTGTVRARDGAGRVAIANAGTIPDRGLFGVFLADGGGRVGELDEEMVYEAREGQVFLLGASSWRIEEITRDRVIVTPAPGAPGRDPVLEGRGGRAAGRARRAPSARSAASSRRCPTSGRRAADGRARLRRARPRPTSSRTCASRRRPPAWCPRDRALVVERFRDEIGDWRLCLLSPFGGRVHAPWALALGALLRREHGHRGPVGVVRRRDHPAPAGLRRPPPDAELVMLDPDDARGPAGRRARRLGAVRRPLPRERRPGAPDPAPPAGPAHPAVAAAAEGPVAAAGGRALRLVPDRARDLPRAPAGPLRPAALRGLLARRAPARDRGWCRSRPSTPRRSPAR